MLLLTPENKTFDTSLIGAAVPDEMYSSLDLSNMNNVDYFFNHILQVTTFTAFSVKLQIGEYEIVVPLNWQILLGDEESGMMEVCSIENILNMQNPCAFVYNPISSMYAKFLPVKITAVYQIYTKWTVPCLDRRNMLTVPLTEGDKPLCAYFADDNDKFQDFTFG